jgi:hypothetical protein
MATTAQPVSVRSLSNRIFLAFSGRRFRAYSIVVHVGRRSGRTFRNPVSAYPLGDGFVIAVLYGTTSQWVQNVLAAGSFVLRTRNVDHPLERPELIGPDVALPAHPALTRKMLQRRRIEHFVWGHTPPAASG